MGDWILAGQGLVGLVAQAHAGCVEAWLEVIRGVAGLVALATAT